MLFTQSAEQRAYERMMTAIPNFSPRGHGAYYFRARPTWEDYSCDVCAYQLRNKCQLDHCCCMTERIRVGMIPMNEVLKELGYPDTLEGFEVDEDQFTLRLNLDFCPFVSDDEDEEETNEMITAEDLVEQAVYAANAPDCCSEAEQAENMLEMLGANIMDDDIYHDEDEHPGFVPSM